LKFIKIKKYRRKKKPSGAIGAIHGAIWRNQWSIGAIGAIFNSFYRKIN
jgi:hypothetical protein